MSREQPTPPESSGPIDWSTYLQQLPARADVDPDNKLSGTDISEKITNHFKARGVEFNRGDVYDVREYPEMVDPTVQELTRLLNAHDFARTYASCGGHAHEQRGHEEQAPSISRREGHELEYVEPYFSILIDRHDPQSAQLVGAMKSAVQEIPSMHPNVHVEVTEERLNERVTLVTFSESLTVPEQWITENDKKSPQDLDHEIDAARTHMGVVDPPKTKDFSDLATYEEALRTWESSHQATYEQWLTSEYVGRYKQEYQDYFASPSARTLVDTFFERLAKPLRNNG